MASLFENTLLKYKGNFKQQVQGAISNHMECLVVLIKSWYIGHKVKE